VALVRALWPGVRLSLKVNYARVLSALSNASLALLDERVITISGDETVEAACEVRQFRRRRPLKTA
jgi:hypothetical protein